MSIFDEAFTPPRLPPAERHRLRGICIALADLIAAEPGLRDRVLLAQGRDRFDLQQALDRHHADIAALRAEFDAMCDERRAA